MTTNPAPVDLTYLSDRARAYVMGLEAKVRELREANQRIIADQQESPRIRQARREGYREGWRDCASLIFAIDHTPRSQQ